MLRILAQSSSSGTGAGFQVSASAIEPLVDVGVWNTAEVSFIAPAPTKNPVRSPRPLSAIADMAVDLGPADLSETFRTRR